MLFSSRIRAATVFGATLVLTPLMAAQNHDSSQPDQRQAGARKPAAAQSAEADRVLATWLLVGSDNEVALARLAQQRAQSDAVKQFAQQMIEDHTKISGELRRFAGGPDGMRDRVGSAATDPNRQDAHRDNPNSNREDPEHTPERGHDRSGEPADASGRGRDRGMMPQVGDFDHVGLVRELGQKCLQSSTQMLQEKQGADFDKCYMGMQVGAHMQTIDAIQVFQNHASSELRQVLDQGLQTVQAHFEHAKRLVKALEGDKTTDSVRDRNGDANGGK